MDPDGERIKVARRKYTASNLEYIEGGIENISESDYDKTMYFTGSRIKISP